MVASANISDKSIHPQEGSNKQIFFRLHPHANIAITRSSLVVLKNDLRHLVPHMILHLVMYRLSIFLKWRTTP